jgi:hypothetical protein
LSYELEGSNYYNAPTFLSLNDNGTLSIYPGTNGVATGSAITTIFTQNATNLKELDLTSIDYDFSKGTITNETPVAGLAVLKMNNSSTQQTASVTLTLTHTDTETFNWSESHAVATKIEAKSKLPIPGLESELTLGVTETTTITNGTSDAATDTTTFTLQDQLTVPAGATYSDQLMATQGMEAVPYTFTGTATFDNGKTGIVTGTGVYTGVTTGDFVVETNCVSSPTNCAGVAPVFTPLPGPTVPEPSTWAMMLIGFAGLGFAGYRASRRSAVA